MHCAAKVPQTPLKSNCNNWQKKKTINLVKYRSQNYRINMILSLFLHTALVTTYSSCSIFLSNAYSKFVIKSRRYTSCSIVRLDTHSPFPDPSLLNPLRPLLSSFFKLSACLKVIKQNTNETETVSQINFIILMMQDKF